MAVGPKRSIAAYEWPKNRVLVQWCKIRGRDAVYVNAEPPDDAYVYLLEDWDIEELKRYLDWYKKRYPGIQIVWGEI